VSPRGSKIPGTDDTDNSLLKADQTLPPLPYEYDALEPAISEQIMRQHHTKHHQIYIDRLNAAEWAYADAVSSNDIPRQIELQSAIKHHGGGHINHSLFWKNLAPVKQGGGQLSEGGSAEQKKCSSILTSRLVSTGPLKQAIERDFGSLDKLKEHFNKTSTALQGSGYGWVGYNPSNQRIEVVTTANQDTLTTHHPLIVVDVWEHACYL
jgi:Fe-Mn family superoxide dismutase